ncbi:esterase/lipase family protein [Acanthopleuribacter pedis]|uniref:triacylglycerol lipase n=1 Tax=Acanthopleuribacter pedis TaxID=442870 RepID=A0A8J7Q3P6_9BACT|nr:hypothetical protein [Acanthopleuribacter pedis]MBO1317071.1 hypothetical protein [Acanthopleuribacter pedis]
MTIHKMVLSVLLLLSSSPAFLQAGEAHALNTHGFQYDALTIQQDPHIHYEFQVPPAIEPHVQEQEPEFVDPALQSIRHKAGGNGYPLVLVHGFLGWGRDELLGFKYWGGFYDTETDLNNRGYQVHTAAVGPVSSNWDRACELYAQILGTRVDYGAEHARIHGHDRFGKTYHRGLYEDWGRTTNGKRNKIHLLAHSQGGQTVRVLAHLLKYGDPAQRDGESEPDSIFYGGRADWVSSAMTLAAPHDGTTLATGITTFVPFAKDLIAAIASLAGVLSDALVYDFKLDHWGLRREAGESFSSYNRRVWNSRVWQPDMRDISAWDLSPDGAREINQRFETISEVYYFSYGTEATYRGIFTGHHYPELLMFLPFQPMALFMGAYKGTTVTGIRINSDWYQNDGIVNTLSMDGPDLGSNATIRGWNGSPQRGVWQHFGVLGNWDHFDVIGTGERNTRQWFRDIAAFLNSLPD